MLDRLFLAHPRAVGESYLTHQRVALSVGAALLGAGLASLVHALVPALCERTASRTILSLQERIRGRTQN